MKYAMPDQFESERLIIRMFNSNDWKDLHNYYSDAQATN